MSYSLYSLVLGALAFVFLLVIFRMQWKGASFTKAILVAVVAGAILGIVGHAVLPSEIAKTSQLKELFNFIGSVYISLLKMIVIPLVFSSLVSAILRLSRSGVVEFGRSVIFFVILLLLMTAVSAGIGVGVAKAMGLGKGIVLPEGTLPYHVGSIGETFLGLLPSNPIKDASNGNAAALAIFSVFFGMAAFVVKKREITDISMFEGFISQMFEISKQLARFVIMLTPYGVLALLISAFLTTGKAALITMMGYVLVMYIAMLLVLVMHMLLVWFQGVSPKAYLCGVYQALLVAFTTQSSLGALPVTQSVLKERMKVHQDLASFAPTMGASMGMNACAGIFPAVLVAIALTASHTPITWETFALIMVVNAIASLGLSGIPGTASVAASVTLSTLGLPFGVLALVQGVDSLVDMGRTATNVSGVMSAAIVIDRRFHKKEPMMDDNSL